MSYAGYPVDTDTTSHHGTLTPEVWSTKMILDFFPQLVLPYISNTDYEGEIKKFGDIIKARYTAIPTIRDYVLNKDLTVDPVTASVREMMIDNGKYWALNIQDLQQRQSDVPYVNDVIGKAAIALKNAIEEEVFSALHTQASADNIGDTAGKISGAFNLGTTSVPVELDKQNVIDFIVNLGTVLDEQNIPRDDNGRWLLLPFWMTNLIKKSEIKQVYVTGDEKSALRTGNIGMIDNFNIFSSPFVTASEGKTYYRPLFGHKKALSFATQFVKQETLRSETQFGDIMRGLNVFGFKVFYPEAFGYAIAKKAASENPAVQVFISNTAATPVNALVVNDAEAPVVAEALIVNTTAAPVVATANIVNTVEAPVNTKEVPST